MPAVFHHHVPGGHKITFCLLQKDQRIKVKEQSFVELY